eukprot:Sspe_Gene.105098::Locus_82145_Transcript_1_2_Confidence_0.750_Length_1646::g.105098::m.105098
MRKKRRVLTALVAVVLLWLVATEPVTRSPHPPTLAPRPSLSYPSPVDLSAPPYERYLEKRSRDPIPHHPFACRAASSIFDYFPPYAQCDVRERIGPVSDGGKWVCGSLSPPCLIYSFGVRDDVSFEVEAATMWGCTVRAFDPTISRPPPEFRSITNGTFARIGMGPKDGVWEGCGMTRRAESCKVRRLQTLMAEYGDTHIDLLKVDIDGAEWEVFKGLEGAALPFDQLLIELHAPLSSSAPPARFFDALAKAGFHPFSREANVITCLPTPRGRGALAAFEYSFLRYPRPVGGDPSHSDPFLTFAAAVQKRWLRRRDAEIERLGGVAALDRMGPWGGAGYIWDWLRPYAPCKHKEWLGGFGKAGWWVCLDRPSNPSAQPQSLLGKAGCRALGVGKGLSGLFAAELRRLCADIEHWETGVRGALPRTLSLALIDLPAHDLWDTLPSLLHVILATPPAQLLIKIQLPARGAFTTLFQLFHTLELNGMVPWAAEIDSSRCCATFPHRGAPDVAYYSFILQH